MVLVDEMGVEGRALSTQAETLGMTNWRRQRPETMTNVDGGGGSGDRRTGGRRADHGATYAGGEGVDRRVGDVDQDVGQGIGAVGRVDGAGDGGRRGSRTRRAGHLLETQASGAGRRRLGERLGSKTESKDGKNGKCAHKRACKWYTKADAVGKKSVVTQITLWQVHWIRPRG